MSAPFAPLQLRNRIYQARYGLTATIVIFNMLDVILTSRIMHMGGTEQNPLVAAHMDGNGWIVVKMAITLGFAGLLLVGLQRGSRIAVKVAIAAIMFYSFVVGWNAYLLFWRA